MKSGMVLVLFFVLIVALFFSFTDHGHMWGGEGRMDSWHLGGYMWILLLIALLVVVYLLWQNTRSKTEDDKETPLEILKKRFAKGEISKEQFEEMKKDLEG
jgi:putative membrane protein